MNNILVIDDEPIIVDTLYQMLTRLDQAELNIWKANSAEDGILIMRNVRIDILFTDVRMPVMNGMELASLVKTQWPRCKIIFLSGYSDFEYIQGAFRNNAFDYLLKPIGDAILLETLDRVVKEIAADYHMHDVMEQAVQQVHKAQDLLHKDFFEHLLYFPMDAKAIHEGLEQLSAPLQASKDVLLLLRRVDRWPAHLPFKDKLLLQYAINNIVEEYISSACHCVTYMDDSYVVYLLQTKSGDEPNPIGIYELERLHWYISELLEKIQLSILHFLQLQVSFVLSKPDLGWQQIHYANKEMIDLLQRGIGLDGGIIRIEQADTLISHYADQEFKHWDVNRMIQECGNLLETGDKAAYRASLTTLFKTLQNYVFLDYLHQMEIFSKLTNVFLSYINARQAGAMLEASIDLKMLANYTCFANWPAFEDYCFQLCELLFSYSDGEKKNQKKEIINKVDTYIVQTFNLNPSLDQLAKEFHLSPYYLSRLYHAEQGIPISERIKWLKINKAKQLLLQESTKVQDVAEALGFDNTSYFAKFFRKHTGMTPHMYKQSNSN